MCPQSSGGREDRGHLRLKTEPSIAAIFPSQMSFDEFGCYEHRFLDIPSYIPGLFGNFKAF